MATGRTFSFEEALEHGLVNHLYEAETFWEDALAYAKQFCPPNKASHAVGLMKRAVVTGSEVGFGEALAQNAAGPRYFGGLAGVKILAAADPGRRLRDLRRELIALPGGSLDQLALEPAARDRQQHGFDPDLGHAFGERHRLPHRLLAFGEIDDGPGLDAARLDLAIAHQLDGVAAPAQRIARRTRFQPRDHACDLAGPDVERSDQRGAPARYRARLGCQVSVEDGHAASPGFFLTAFLS